MLERREHLAGREHGRLARALQSFDRRDTHLADQVGILAERLLDAAPARIASDIDDRGQRQTHAARAYLARGHRVDRAQQSRVPARGERDRLRKARGAARRVAVQTLLVEQDRNPEAGARQGVALQAVDEANRALHVAARQHARRGRAGRVRRPCELAQSQRIFLGELRGVELELRIEQLRTWRPRRLSFARPFPRASCARASPRCAPRSARRHLDRGALRAARPTTRAGRARLRARLPRAA